MSLIWQVHFLLKFQKGYKYPCQYSAADNLVALKADFILSRCELIIGNKTV